MTIARARELLGEDVAHLSDDEVGKLNNDTSEMCGKLLTFLISHPVRKHVIDDKNLVV